MGQQPSVVVTEGEAPRPDLEPGPARSWRPDKPGVPRGPEEVPRGGAFGYTGPDQGWAYVIIARTELPDDDPRLRDVLAALMMARAAALGRAPVPQDLEVALVLSGYGEDAPPELKERRERWLEAAAHEPRPGEMAVTDVDLEMMLQGPDQVRSALQHASRS
jgi:hypothetical protein